MHTWVQELYMVIVAYFNLQLPKTVPAIICSYSIRHAGHERLVYMDSCMPACYTLGYMWKNGSSWPRKHVCMKPQKL
jgi:hypothetical protein